MDYGIILILAAWFYFFLGGGRRKFIHTLVPQAAPRIEPEFPLSLWIRVHRGMLVRVVTFSGHRGPGPSSCCAHRRVKRPFDV